MPKTNPREEQVLNFIREFSAENGYAPSIREICAGVGLRSTASVNYHLKNLQQKGMLTLGEKGRKRAIAAPQRPGQIPPSAPSPQASLSWLWRTGRAPSAGTGTPPALPSGSGGTA